MCSLILRSQELLFTLSSLHQPQFCLQSTSLMKKASTRRSSKTPPPRAVHAVRSIGSRARWKRSRLKSAVAAIPFTPVRSRLMPAAAVWNALGRGWRRRGRRSKGKSLSSTHRARLLHFPLMNERQARLLTAIIEEFIRSAEPVGSKHILAAGILPYPEQRSAMKCAHSAMKA